MDIHGYGVDGDVFAASRHHFDRLLGFLGGDGAAELTHAELEEQLATPGRQLLRQLLQDHLDLRALREVRLDSIVDAAGAAPRATPATSTTASRRTSSRARSSR